MSKKKIAKKGKVSKAAEIENKLEDKLENFAEKVRKLPAVSKFRNVARNKKFLEVLFAKISFQGQI